MMLQCPISLDSYIILEGATTDSMNVGRAGRDFLLSSVGGTSLHQARESYALYAGCNPWMLNNMMIGARVVLSNPSVAFQCKLASAPWHCPFQPFPKNF